MSRSPKNPKRVVAIVPSNAKVDCRNMHKPQSKSYQLAKKPIRTTHDYAEIMATLMSDVIRENISIGVVNSAVNAGRQLIKVAELNLKYSNLRKHATNSMPLDLLKGE